MITIDEQKCNSCRLCERICHEHCIKCEGRSVTIEHAFCSTCGQCIAICPFASLSWDSVAPVPFEDEKLPSSEQMAELFGQRRTVRQFQPQKLDRNLLGEIVAIGIYAPTHNFELRAIVVDDDTLIDAVDAAVISFSRKVYFWVYRNRLLACIARLCGSSVANEFARAKPKLEHSLELGKAYKSRPPAIILIVGDRKTPLSLESAQYALYTMNLYAMTRQVACRNLVGNQMIFNRNRKLRKELGIVQGERIFAAMAVGLPAIRFRNKVMGKKMRLSWNGATP